MHGNVKDSEEELWKGHVSKSIFEIARSEGIVFLGNARQGRSIEDV